MPTITQRILLDGESQSGATCASSIASRDLRVVLDGTNAGAVDGLALGIGSLGSTIHGLVINSFGGNGIRADVGGHRFTCTFIGTDVTGLVDSANAGFGIRLNGASDFNVIGTDGDGVGDNTEGNLISGNASHGMHIRPGSSNNTVAGNYIGLNSAGNATLGNSNQGILLSGPNNVIGTNADGTSDDIEANFIGGNGGHGLWLNQGTSTGNRVFGNYIGTDATGTTNLGNGSNGVLVGGSASDNFIGTDNDNSGDDKEGNVIAFNGQDGVRILSGSTGNSVLRNSIFSNVQLGIDLDGDGATPNDSLDDDGGANNLQNFPDLVSASLGSLTMIYSVDSDTAHSAFPLRVEFFKADADNEEGKRFLGFDTYTISEWSGCGSAPCADTVSFTDMGLVPGDSLVATATDSLGNTSEFSSPIGLTLSGVSLFVKAFLEGPYSSADDKMNTALFDGAELPVSQPFSDSTYNGTVLDFDSTQSVESHADSTVDWLLVSLRTGTEAGTEVAGTKHAAVIFEGGTIGSPGDDSLRFGSIEDGTYYLVLRSRNHLDIMSSSAIDVSGGSASWDFTTAATQAYPGDDASAQKQLETGVWGMFAGDGSVDGQVTATDFNDWLVDTKAVSTGYLQTDFNLDVQVTASDFNLWLVNTKAVVTSKVP